MRTIFKKIRMVVTRSPATGLLTLLFAAVLVVLLTRLMLQVQHAYDVAMPVGQGGSGPGPAVTGKDEQEILILNSYHHGYSWSDHEMDGIVEAFTRSSFRVQARIEYLDCKQFPDMKHFERISDLFLQKYRGKRFPVVIAADNPALAFALRYRPRLFPDASIVFCGINGFTAATIAGQKNITGIAERLDALGTMSIAMKLHPRTREAIVVHDYTVTGLSTRRETEEQLRPFEGLVTFRFVENMPTNSLMAYLRNISPDSLVLALSYSLDKDGRVVNHEQIARLLSMNAPVPVYGLHEERIGYGILGGSLVSGRMHGIRAAEMAMRVLSGVPASTIPVDMKPPTQVMFDYNQLKRFSIPLSLLPGEAVIVNRPISFFARYPGLVLTTAGIIVILAVGIIALGFNIYRRRVAEEEQGKLQAQLLQAQKMEAVGLLAGGVAHDFNNIMTAILGYANLLRKRMQADDLGRTFLDHILSSGERAVNLTRGLLAFGRKQVIETKPVDLNALVKSIEKIVMPIIGADIVFTTMVPEQSVTVLADSGQIEQVVMNLCTNARDAMPQGGRLTVEVGKVAIDEAARKSQLLERSGPYGVISVSDTGTGMNEQTKKMIFEPFFSTKEVGKGTGLGLSIAYGIIKQHKGMITVYSEPGRGTMFKAYLPLTSLPPQEAALPKSAEAAEGGRETILVAEDEEGVRSMIALVLRDAGYTVIEAEDGEDALQKFRQHKDSIDLLITDVIMPRKNGNELYEQIMTVKPEVKVLFMSGYTAKILDDRETTAQFLAKPILQKDLLTKVRKVLLYSS